MIAVVLGAVIAERWFVRHRGLVLGILTASNATGQLIFLPTLASISVNFGWRAVSLSVNLGYRSAYPTITGGIFEVGFTDSILQMWAAFCDELAQDEKMRQPFYCATPQEAHQSHLIFDPISCLARQ